MYRPLERPVNGIALESVVPSSALDTSCTRNETHSELMVPMQVSSPDELEQCDEETLAALLSTDAKVNTQQLMATLQVYNKVATLQTVLAQCFACATDLSSKSDFIASTANVMLHHHCHVWECGGRMS